MGTHEFSERDLRRLIETDEEFIKNLACAVNYGDADAFLVAQLSELAETEQAARLREEEELTQLEHDNLFISLVRGMYRDLATVAVLRQL